MPEISRRAILKTISLLGLSSASRFVPDSLNHALAQADLPDLPVHWNGEPLGRISGETMNVRAEPTMDSEIVAVLYQDEVVRVRQVVKGQTAFFYNDLWLETELGYLYSSFVQPMRYHLPQPPQADLGAGRWADVIVPYTDAQWDAGPSLDGRYPDRFYYGSIVRVIGLKTGRDGRAWYQVEELYQQFYMRATHLHIIPPEDLTPLSPEVDGRDKRLEVNLTDQILTAYEGDTAVYRHRVATGLGGHATPEGRHYIFDKRASERMVGGRAASEDDSDRYNLGGVPFVCYFTGDWVATHGTYWHNDYGQPRSHGCVNLPFDAARWVWRWTLPYSDHDTFVVRPENYGEGTPVIVYY